MDHEGEERFGSFILLGFAIGGITGMVVEAGSGNTFYGFWIGGLAGIFLGWFIAAAISLRRKHEN